MSPSKEKVVQSINFMAEVMEFDPLPTERVEELIEHVLYDQYYNGVSGKRAWFSFESGLITERETRNLLMAHSATKIASHNRRDQPSSDIYSRKELSHSFDFALFGRASNPIDIDLLDPWES